MAGAKNINGSIRKKEKERENQDFVVFVNF
jgi:hypothetical protein